MAAVPGDDLGPLAVRGRQAARPGQRRKDGQDRPRRRRLAQRSGAVRGRRHFRGHGAPAAAAEYVVHAAWPARGRQRRHVAAGAVRDQPRHHARRAAALALDRRGARQWSCAALLQPRLPAAGATHLRAVHGRDLPSRQRGPRPQSAHRAGRVRLGASVPAGRHPRDPERGPRQGRAGRDRGRAHDRARPWRPAARPGAHRRHRSDLRPGRAAGDAAGLARGARRRAGKAAHARGRPLTRRLP